jgi:serine/threonine-protein kinase
LENERQILSDLKHPFIVRLLDSGTVDGQPFLVLEHIDGLPIDCFCTERNLQLEARLALFLKVCAAVQYAHQRGVLHCDLKPTNVLVTDDICPIVIDFGVARRLGCKGTNDPPGAVFGTPAYMSPEQASGRTDTLGPEADVYALGALLYKLLTGQPPFQGSSMLKTLDLVSTRSPIPPRHLHPLLPRDVDAISLKCLEKKPDDRYPTVAELAADLESFLAGRRTLEGMGQHQHGEQK